MKNDGIESLASDRDFSNVIGSFDKDYVAFGDKIVPTTRQYFIIESIEPKEKKKTGFIKNLKVYFTSLINTLKTLKPIKKVKVNRERSKAFIVGYNDDAYEYFKKEFGDCTNYNNSLIVPDHESEEHRIR